MVPVPRAPLIVLAIGAGLIIWLFVHLFPAPDFAAVEASTGRSGMYCSNCGSIGKPTNRVKGSFWIELVLWLCFLVPGVIYSIWRLTTKEKVCPKCGAPNMIPAAAPKALEAKARATKMCPYCAETIQAAAILCKHCGRDLPKGAPLSSIGV